MVNCIAQVNKVCVFRIATCRLARTWLDETTAIISALGIVNQARWIVPFNRLGLCHVDRIWASRWRAAHVAHYFLHYPVSGCRSSQFAGGREELREWRPRRRSSPPPPCFPSKAGRSSAPFAPRGNRSAAFLSPLCSQSAAVRASSPSAPCRKPRKPGGRLPPHRRRSLRRRKRRQRSSGSNSACGRYLARKRERRGSRRRRRTRPRSCSPSTAALTWRPPLPYLSSLSRSVTSSSAPESTSSRCFRRWASRPTRRGRRWEHSPSRTPRTRPRPQSGSPPPSP